MTPQFLPVHGMQLAYYEKHPEKEHTIFFLHGNSSSSRNWLGQWESPMFEGYRLIAIDMPAHGASGVSADPASDYTLKGLAVLLAELVNVLARGPYILCATSLATNIAAEMIACGIEPAGILLEGASVMGEGIGLDKVALPGADISALTKDEASPEGAEHYSQFVLYAANGEMRKQFVDDFVAVQAPFRTTIIGSVFSGQMSDQVNLLRTLSCPVAFIYGREERVINTQYLSEVQIPKWRDKICLITGAGHLAHVEQPEAFNALLSSFAQDCFT